MKIKLIAFVLLLLSGHIVMAEEKPSIPDVDRIRLAEVYRLSEVIDDRIWQGWSKAPFGVLLITPDYEFLIHHPQPSEDFTRLGYDALLKSDVYFRKRIFPTRLLATAPFIKGSSIPVIAVGEAENTEAKSSTPWVITLFHEHFHQLQDTQPTYYADVQTLNLAHGDQTGGWMLSYAFPYDRKEAQDEFAALSKLLVDALDAQGRRDGAAKLRAYLQAREKFQQSLNADDYKYFAFQFWQEGIARYTEYRVAKLAADGYEPTKEFHALKDFTSFAEEAGRARERIIKQLLTQQLGVSKREVVYPFGAAEGLLLDQVNPTWQSRYFTEKFDLGRYYEAPK